MKKIILSLVVAVAFNAGTVEIPVRPEKLKFPKLQYEPPSGAKYRVQLKSGPVVFVVPNRELPLVSVSIMVRTGQYNEPKGKAGVAGMTGYLLGKGGTKSRTAEELEERLA
ncbi:MAG: insulinase family protein, partial [Verrucomicrobiales bacterium]|nr:insulinase family protein [Verrucomicrobiales bacterium]